MLRTDTRRAAPVIALLLTLCLLAGCSSSSAIDPPAGAVPAHTPATGADAPVVSRSATIDGHVLVAENDNWELYLLDSTLSLIVRDKASGAVMRSTVAEPNTADNKNWQGFYQSGVVVDYVQGNNNTMVRCDFLYAAHEKTIYYHDGGFTAEVYFPEVGIGYTLTVAITDYGFTAEIPQSSIRETEPNNKVGAIYVYPFMGYSTLGADEGYMFIPDGQGALITLQDNERRYSQPYIGSVYGGNMGMDYETSMVTQLTVVPAELALMPCYGMVHTAEGIGFLGIIESGAENCFIDAYPNGASTQYDWISSRFIYNQVFRQPMGQSADTVQTRTERAARVDIKLRFAFVSGERASYSGLALRFREYLADTGAFDSAVMDSYRTQVDFFGSDKKNWAVFKLNVNMTTFDQAADILKDLSESGVTGTLSVYTAWQSGGHIAGLPITDYDPARNLGGSGDIKRLLSTADEMGSKIHLQIDAMTINPEVHPFEALNAMKRVTGRTIEYNYDGWVYNSLRYLNPFRSLELAVKGAPGLSKSGVHGLSLVNTTNTLASFKESNTYYDRTDCATLYDELTRTYADAMPLVLDEAVASQWKYAAALVNMPMSGSSYIYTAAEIPFLSIAVSGQLPVYAEYTNFQANQAQFFLKLVESGARPSFLVTHENPSLLQRTDSSDIYSSQYDLYKDQIIEYDQALKALHAHIGGATIESHERVGDLVTVRYDSGFTILINYGEQTADIAGHSVPALSYKEVTP